MQAMRINNLDRADKTNEGTAALPCYDKSYAVGEAPEARADNSPGWLNPGFKSISYKN
jgi:hypothetical protein